MSGRSYDAVEFGEELPAFQPDVSLANVRRFTGAAGMTFPRFHDHEAARKEGLPGAIVPGIMSQGILTALIHRWSPGARVLPDHFPRFSSGFGFDAGKCVTVLGPIRVGDRVTAKSKIHDIYTKTGRSGTMLFIVHRMEFSNQRGEPVSIVDWRMVQRAGQ